MNEDLEFDIDEEYNGFFEYMIGLEIRKKPSAKQKKEILREAMEKSSAGGEYDIEELVLKHAKDCFDPIYLEQPAIWGQVKAVMEGFLPPDHSSSRELIFNQSDPKVNIKNLLKKPSTEQVAAAVTSLREAYPGWTPWGDDEAAAKITALLGMNFPELKKDTALVRKIFGGAAKPPKSPRREKKKKKPWVAYLVLVIILYVLYKSLAG